MSAVVEGFENLTRVVVNRTEAGKRTVLDIELVALAKALRVSIQQLLMRASNDLILIREWCLFPRPALL